MTKEKEQVKINKRKTKKLSPVIILPPAYFQHVSPVSSSLI